MPEETVTLTVKALREMLAKQDVTCFWLNLPYTSNANYRRVLQIRDAFRNDPDDATLSFELQVNDRVTKRLLVSMSDLFALADNVRNIVSGVAKDYLPPALVERIIEELEAHDNSASYATSPELLAKLKALQ